MNSIFNISYTNETINAFYETCMNKSSFDPYPEYTKRLIKRLKICHGNKYDYSLVKYPTHNEKIIIICKYHGNFKISLSNAYGVTCPSCRKYRNIEKLIKKYDQME